MSTPRHFYGKYRASVTNNVDPMQQGRLLLSIPDVLGAVPSSWAMPCFPASGRQMGVWTIPQIGAGVWAEFEQGDPDFPIWSGCWFGSSSEVPPMALSGVPATPPIVMQTQGQTTFMLSDTPGPTGGILLKLTSGAMIAVNDVGITISNGKGAGITLNGSTVSINNGALVVT